MLLPFYHLDGNVDPGRYYNLHSGKALSPGPFTRAGFCVKRIEQGKIIPVHRFENHTDDQLEKFQYADFAKDFDEGFKKLTYLITGERLTTWEYLHNSNDHEILQCLGKGLISSTIVKEFAEWLIVYNGQTN
jgi:hypothetical protein